LNAENFPLIVIFSNICSENIFPIRFLLSMCDSNESIDFVQGKSKFFIEVLNELELFTDKKVIFDEKKKFRVRRLSTNFVIRINLFPFNLETSPFQVKVF
jgi:hypothetical protein